jgi:predicted homoserine dehydrogenase-like protein
MRFVKKKITTGRNVNYQNLFKSSRITNVGVIGMGTFGRSFLAQSRLIPHIGVPVVCDRDVAVARQACLKAGLPPGTLKICGTEAEVNDSIASGKTAVVGDAALLMDLPISVVMEASGMPEAGALHALKAIESGKHVVMVTKETDCVVGPELNRRAQNAGLVYTPADGDQPSLLFGLISWAQSLGFEILCAGKSAEFDFVLDPILKTISRDDSTVSISDLGLWELADLTAEERIHQRRRTLESLVQFSVADLCEMAIVLNGTDFDYDAPQLHAPIARITEMPEIMCLQADGGVFQKEGIVDMVNCLRRPDEAGFGGGVFVVIKCRAQNTWPLLKSKGHLVSRDGTRAIILRPYHLLGLETATSVLAANLVKQSTGSNALRPRVDLGARTCRELQKGELLALELDHSISGVMPEIIPATGIATDNPIPYYMAAGNRLKYPVEEGSLLTYDMIRHDTKSCLWNLRRDQDAAFGLISRK